MAENRIQSETESPPDFKTYLVGFYCEVSFTGRDARDAINRARRALGADDNAWLTVEGPPGVVGKGFINRFTELMVKERANAPYEP